MPPVQREDVMPRPSKPGSWVSFTAKLPEHLIVEMKIQALLEKRDARDIIVEAVEAYLAKAKKKNPHLT